MDNRKFILFIALSTSGNSKNINNAIRKAKEKGIFVISLIGKDGGTQCGTGDIDIVVPSKNTPKIQEAHLAIMHIMCELAELELFPQK